MTEEELAAKAAMEAKAKADADEKSEEDDKDENPDDSDDDKKEEDKPDYDALLAEERTRREAAEKAAADAEFKLREKKRKKDEDEDEGDEDEDKPLTAKQLQAILAKDREQNKKEILSATILDRARKLASSESEANYIAEIHKNRSFPDNLSLDEQLEECYAIANRKVLLAKNDELKRALKSKDTANRTGASAHKDGDTAGASKLASADHQALVDAGMVWDATKRLYKKPIAGGKKNLFFDPKTRKRFVA